MGIGLGIAAAMRHEVLSPAAIQSAILLPVVVVSVLASSGAAFAFSLAFGRQRLRLGAPTGFGLVRVGGRATLLFLLAGVALSSLFCVVAPHLAAVPSPETMGPLAQMAASPGVERNVWFVLALLIAPLAEEYVFRGVLASGLRARLGAAATIAIVTVVFTLMHVTEALSYWPAFLSIAALGVVAGIARERTGSLGPAVAAHFGYNLVIAAVATGG